MLHIINSETESANISFSIFSHASKSRERFSQQLFTYQSFFAVFQWQSKKSQFGKTITTYCLYLYYYYFPVPLKCRKCILQVVVYSVFHLEFKKQQFRSFKTQDYLYHHCFNLFIFLTAEKFFLVCYSLNTVVLVFCGQYWYQHQYQFPIHLTFNNVFLGCYLVNKSWFLSILLIIQKVAVLIF